ncbi:type I restriction enzyme, S subunit [Salegentibacter agarivorans]|uniref:Type I restriction enzyme, S subunit n=1 Tax=Salegentibacter agarivorans TaxID=345907 RepID=A0A1I2NIC0_9FLAO|nr:restriction endonuclease subunit S [Salegentibacter agarivorans]SFG03725.1 type I restriction enzyme, S subunit [Salegentibacter agarivorans]
MNYLEKLLEGVEVEWKEINNISEIYGGLKGKSKEDFTDGNAKYVSYKNIFYNIEVDFERLETVKVASDENQYEVKYGDVIFTGSSETANEAGMSSAVTNKSDIKVYLNSFSFGLRFNSDIELLPEFSKYLFRSHFMRKAIAKTANGVTRFNISKKRFKKLQIPIPTLEIQQKLVDILDSFTKHTTELRTELRTELTGRKQQFTYYREQLLSFDKEEVLHLPLGDENIGEFIRGKRFVKTDILEEGVPAIHYGEMYTHYGTWANQTKSYVSRELVDRKKLRLAEKGNVIIVAAGETIEDIGQGTAWLGDEGVVIHDACFYYKSDLNPKYVAYFTRTRQFHDQIKKHIRTGKISAINAKGLGQAIIPIPSPEEQERIVSILDKFDKLTISISDGLPKEIELRHKQYEYYRTLLLDFPKANVDI